MTREQRIKTGWEFYKFYYFRVAHEKPGYIKRPSDDYLVSFYDKLLSASNLIEETRRGIRKVFEHYDMFCDQSDDNFHAKFVFTHYFEG